MNVCANDFSIYVGAVPIFVPSSGLRRISHLCSHSLMAAQILAVMQHHQFLQLSHIEQRAILSPSQSMHTMCLCVRWNDIGFYAQFARISDCLVLVIHYIYTYI